MKKPIIILAGPTASGKSKLAVTLAKKFNGEVINADSRTVYRHLNIATSKPTNREKDGVPHHLFNVVDLDEIFTVADFQKLARAKITEIQKREKIPFLVGGTGLYLDAVAYNFNLTRGQPNSKLRHQLEDRPTEELNDRLKKLDPEAADKIKDRRRLIRALEVVLSTDQPLYQQQRKDPLPENVLYLAINQPRTELYERINQRVDQWLKTGLIEETESLVKQYPITLPSMSALGYVEIYDYLQNKITLEKATEKMKQRTRHYAKRQLTWFSHNKDVNWVNNEKEASSKIVNFLSKDT